MKSTELYCCLCGDTLEDGTYFPLLVEGLMKEQEKKDFCQNKLCHVQQGYFSSQLGFRTI